MTIPMVIRRATAADTEVLAEFAAAAFRHTYRDIDQADEVERYVRRSFQPRTLRAQIADPGSVLLVAHRGAELVGYAHLRRSKAPACVTGPVPVELARLYLDVGMIGKGHGAALMLEVLGEARATGCRTLWLVVYDGNTRAVGFYRKFGFVRVGETKFLLGDRMYVDPVMTAPIASLPNGAHSPSGKT